MTMITPSYLGETIEYSSLHACRSTLEDPTLLSCDSVLRILSQRQFLRARREARQLEFYRSPIARAGGTK